MTATRPMLAHWRLVCLLCGRSQEIAVHVAARMDGPIYCGECRGRVMAEYEGSSLPIDTLDQALWPAPPRGRPPRWLVERREREAQEMA